MATPRQTRNKLFAFAEQRIKLLYGDAYTRALKIAEVRHCCEGKRNIVGCIFFMWAENWNGSTELSDEQKRKYEIAMKRAASRQRKSA